MVFFGTGQYLGATDTTSTSTQSIYGVLDSSTFSSGSFSGGTYSLVRATNLVQQTLTYYTIGGKTYPTDTTNTVSYPPVGTQFGWYADLPTSGERVIQQATISSGRVKFVTLIPNSGSCSYGGSSVTLSVDPATGGSPPNAFLDINGDGNYDSNDNITVDGKSLVVIGTVFNAILSRPAIFNDGNNERDLYGGSDTNVYSTTEKSSHLSPRASWTQIQ